MNLKTSFVLLTLLVTQSFGVGVFAQTELLEGCAKGADGEIDCSEFVKQRELERLEQSAESAAPQPSASPIKTRSIVPGAEATRIFAHPGLYPPREFGAYAVVAFKSGADASDRDRYVMICRAYMSAVPDSIASNQPKSHQLATVWPLRDEIGSAAVAEAMSNADACEAAVDFYGHTAALSAIRDARAVSPDMHEQVVRSRGPFLFAWNPGHTKGQPDALILRMDLSDVDQPVQAKRRFEFWVQEIEENPQLWLDGWQKLPIRNRLAETADRYGQILLDFLGG